MEEDLQLEEEVGGNLILHLQILTFLDNKVRVWSLKPVIDENDSETPKSLSVLGIKFYTN